MDADGDGGADLDATRIFYYGNSAGSMYGAMFLALEPDVSVAVLGVPGGLTGEHGRWAPGRRANFFGPQLRDRVPSLLNAPGITAVDGVAINPPHFDENKPLRDQPPVVNTVEGAIAIQEALAMHQWGQQAGQSPLPWVRHLGEAPLRQDLWPAFSAVVASESLRRMQAGGR